MLKKAKEKGEFSNVKMYPIGMGDKALEELVPHQGFDAIVCTLVLCTVPNLEKTIEDFKRFLAPTGKLIIMEHIHAKENPKAMFQNIINPLWKQIGDGCNLNRKTDEKLKQKGFKPIKDTYFKHAKLDFYQGVFIFDNQNKK